jgi:hypothetical protein
MQDVAPDQLQPSYAERLPVPLDARMQDEEPRVSRRKNNTQMMFRRRAVRPWVPEV